MLTRTTITAIRTLIYIGLHPEGEPLSIRRVAEQLGESPTYLAKVARQLVRAGILKARHGVTGGMGLNRPPEAVTLLAVVEACQGAILADFCQETRTLDGVCGFHAAAAGLHKAIVRSLSGWTLSQFIDRPGPSGRGSAVIPCMVQLPATEATSASNGKRPHPGRVAGRPSRTHHGRIGR